MRMPQEERGGAEPHFETPTLFPTDRERTVFVIHGRDKRARREFFTFLRSLGLHPYEWTEVLAAADQGAPYIGHMLERAMGAGQAVVVLLTPDDVAYLKPQHADEEDDPDCRPTGQARPNVLFEAGMAFGCFPERTILVELGKVRPFTDIGGRFVVRLDNSVARRQMLATLLRKVGCAVHDGGKDWHTTGDLTPTMTDPEPSAQRLAAKSVPLDTRDGGRIEALTLQKITVKTDEVGTHTVYGEARNNESRAVTAILEATFYDSEEEIMGAASGVVSDIAPGRIKNFRLSTRDDVGGHAEVRVQVDTMFP